MNLLSLPDGDLCSPVELSYAHLLVAVAAPGASGTTPRGQVAAALAHGGTRCARGPAEELAKPPGDRETLGMTRNLGVGAALYRHHQEATRT